MRTITTDLPCPRCARHAAIEERYETQGESTLTCLNCGYQATKERSREAYARLKREGDPTSSELYVTSEHLAPGVTFTEYEDGAVEVAPLPWYDPHGDTYRRQVRERSARTQGRGRILSATLRLKHPSANRWVEHTITP